MQGYKKMYKARIIIGMYLYSLIYNYTTFKEKEQKYAVIALFIVSLLLIA